MRFLRENTGGQILSEAANSLMPTSSPTRDGPSPAPEDISLAHIILMSFSVGAIVANIYYI